MLEAQHVKLHTVRHTWSRTGLGAFAEAPFKFDPHTLQHTSTRRQLPHPAVALGAASVEPACKA